MKNKSFIKIGMTGVTMAVLSACGSSGGSNNNPVDMGAADTTPSTPSPSVARTNVETAARNAEAAARQAAEAAKTGDVGAAQRAADAAEVALEEAKAEFEKAQKDKVADINAVEDA